MKKHVGYVGYRTPNGNPVIRRRPFQKELTPGRSRSLKNYTSDFDWGYSGLGPRQLALAILLDWSVDDDLALALHEQFESRIVTEFADERWELAPYEIKSIVEELDGPSTQLHTPSQNTPSPA